MVLLPTKLYQDLLSLKHQRVDAIVKKKKAERPHGTPWFHWEVCTQHMHNANPPLVTGLIVPEPTSKPTDQHQDAWVKKCSSTLESSLALVSTFAFENSPGFIIWGY